MPAAVRLSEWTANQNKEETEKKKKITLQKNRAPEYCAGARTMNYLIKMLINLDSRGS